MKLILMNFGKEKAELSLGRANLNSRKIKATFLIQTIRGPNRGHCLSMRRSSKCRDFTKERLINKFKKNKHVHFENIPFYDDYKMYGFLPTNLNIPGYPRVLIITKIKIRSDGMQMKPTEMLISVGEPVKLFNLM